MKITDAHAHFTMKQFGKDLDKVVRSMKKAGVWKVVSNGVDHEDNKQILKLCGKYDMFLPAFGIYPTQVIESTDGQIQETFDFIRKNKNKIVAVGEVGIDNFHPVNQKGLTKQIKYFKQIIQLANEIKKPLIVHSRKYEKEIFDLLEDAKVPVVMHCFSGGAQALDIGLGRNYYFTIPCSVLRNKNQRKVAQRVPLNRLLTETDSPYLAPDPKDRNNSSNIKLTIEKVAELRKEPQKKIEKAILENFKRLFLAQ